jgi:hypothetical protein
MTIPTSTCGFHCLHSRFILSAIPGGFLRIVTHYDRAFNGTILQIQTYRLHRWLQMFSTLRSMILRFMDCILERTLLLVPYDAFEFYGFDEPFYCTPSKFYALDVRFDTNHPRNYSLDVHELRLLIHSTSTPKTQRHFSFNSFRLHALYE